MRRAEAVSLAALCFLLLASAAWWALALWPTSADAPLWLERARKVCFNAASDGLPDASGWLLLVGQPVGMFAALVAVSGEALRQGIRRLASAGAGRAVLAGVGALVFAGLGSAGWRVVAAGATPPWARAGAEAPLPDTYPRLDRPAPPLALMDQRGARVRLADLRGQPVLVTFAFGHCETVCPAVVRDCVEAQDRLRRGAAESGAPRLLVVTLDPWRDTPSRLPRLAEHWQLASDAHVLSGPVDEVEAVLTGWNVTRQRDRTTGNVIHPPLVYVVDAEGRIAFASSGGAAVLTELVGRL